MHLHDFSHAWGGSGAPKLGELPLDQCLPWPCWAPLAPSWGLFGAILAYLGAILACLRAILRPSWPILEPTCAKFHPKIRLRRVLDRIFIDFGRILVPQRVDFSDFSKVFRSSGLVRSKKLRLTKNLIKPYVFTRFSHVRSCAHPSKIYKKTPEWAFRASRATDRSRNAIFQAYKRQNDPRGLPGAL